MSYRSATGSLLSTVIPKSNATAGELGRSLEGANRALSYREWLSRNGAKDDPAAGIAEKTARDMGSPDYGAAVEKLIDRGLFKTGYADYLRDKNEAVYRKAIGAIREKNDARGNGNRQGYLAYLKRWEDDQDDLLQKTLSDLAESKVSGIDDAYADALAAGLTDERARLVSRVAPTVARYGMRRLREGISGVLAVSVSAGLSGGEAEMLARASGVSASDAKKLRKLLEEAPPDAGEAR